MNPSKLAEIQRELDLEDAEFAAALELAGLERLEELKSGGRRISEAMADLADRLLDDYRYACLILERKIRPQYDELVGSGEKPAKIALVTELDRDQPEHWTSTEPEARLSIYRQVDRLARIFFETEEVEVVSRVEFIKAPTAEPGEKPPQDLSILGVRVEAVAT